MDQPVRIDVSHTPSGGLFVELEFVDPSNDLIDLIEFHMHNLIEFPMTAWTAAGGWNTPTMQIVELTIDHNEDVEWVPDVNPGFLVARGSTRTRRMVVRGKA